MLDHRQRKFIADLLRRKSGPEYRELIKQHPYLVPKKDREERDPRVKNPKEEVLDKAHEFLEDAFNRADMRERMSSSPKIASQATCKARKNYPLIKRAWQNVTWRNLKGQKPDPLNPYEHSRVR
jgi:hypothetical protein